MKIFTHFKDFLFGRPQLASQPSFGNASHGKVTAALMPLVPICKAVPGARFRFEMRQGHLMIEMDWTPRADADASQAFLYEITPEAGIQQILPTCEASLPAPAADGLDKVDETTVQKASTAPKETLMQRIAGFLTSRYRFRYNVLTEETEVASHEDTVPYTHQRFAKVDDRWLNTLSIEASEAGINCWDRDIQRFVRSRRIEEYHPFTAYFEQLPAWDGTDRVTPLAQRVSTQKVWVNGFHRWMLGLTAQWMQHPQDGRANSVAPLLVSAKQGLGKSTFARLLMPDALKAYYTESYDLNAPAQAEAKLAACGLINLDEFDKLSVSKMPLLKNLMQAPALNIRKAYKRSASTLPRIASFIGTSNREDLLVDRTGSRRFICVNITQAIDCQSPVDHAQLYAQLKEEVLRGERTWFTKAEEEEIQRGNALFYKHVPEEDVFHSCFRPATEEDAPEQVETLSATQIFERLKAAHPKAMRGMTAYSLSRVLPQLCGRLHTVRGNVYRVVLHS